MMASPRDRFRSAAEAVGTGVSLVALGLLLITAVLRAGNGLESMRMIRAFNLDEHRGTQMLLRALKLRSLDPDGFYHYGFAYHELGYAILRACELAGSTVSVYSAAYTLRLISLLSLVGTLWLTYDIQRLLGLRRAWSLAAIVALTAMPAFNQYSTLVHPDLLQVFLIMLASRALLGRTSDTHVLAAAALTGLAFGTKYAGLFFLPVPILAVLLQTPRQDTLRMLLAVVGVFLFAWLASNPYVLGHFDELLADIRYQREHVARGRGLEEPTNPLLWGPVFAGELTLPGALLLLVCVLAAMTWLVRDWTRRNDPALSRAHWFLRSPRRRFLVLTVVFVSTSVAYLMVVVHSRPMRYAFHFLPLLIVLGAVGANRLAHAIPHRMGRALVMLGVSLLCGVLAVRTVHINREAFDHYSETRVLLGNWLSTRYPAKTTIASDKYMYIPELFTRVDFVSSPTVKELKRFKPAVVVLTRRMSGRFCWMEPGASFASGRFTCQRRDRTHRVRALLPWLHSEHSGYELARAEDGYLVFERESAKE